MRQIIVTTFFYFDYIWHHHLVFIEIFTGWIKLWCERLVTSCGAISLLCCFQENGPSVVFLKVVFLTVQIDLDKIIIMGMILVQRCFRPQTADKAEWDSWTFISIWKQNNADDGLTQNQPGRWFCWSWLSVGSLSLGGFCEEVGQV